MKKNKVEPIIPSINFDNFTSRKNSFSKAEVDIIADMYQKKFDNEVECFCGFTRKKKQVKSVEK